MPCKSVNAVTIHELMASRGCLTVSLVTPEWRALIDRVSNANKTIIDGNAS